MDKQKKEIIKSTEEIKNNIGVGEFAKLPEWKNIKDRLVKKLLELDSVSVLFEKARKENKPSESVLEEIKINEKVIRLITEWLMEIEADKNSIEYNLNLLQETKEEGFIVVNEE